MKYRITYLIGLALFAGVFFTSCGGSKEIQEQQVKTPVEDEFKKNFHEAIREKMRGNFDISLTLFQKCLSINQESDAAHFALSDIYEVLGNTEQSISHAESAYQLDGENRWYVLRLADLYYQTGNYHKSAEFFEKAIEEEKNIDVKFKYAESLIHSNNYKQAISMLDEIEVETGKSPNLSLTKHDLYLELGDKESAQNELQTLIDDNPSNIENKLIIADYFLRTNQNDAALKILNETIQQNPNSGEAYLMLADIDLRNGDLDASFLNLEKGFQFDDVSIARKIDLIRSLQPYAFEATEDAPKIEKGLENLFELIYDEQIKNDTLHLAYAYFLRDQGSTQKAIDQFKKTVEINPNSYNTWLQLLYLQYDADQYAGMYADGKESLELFPAQPVVYLLSGIAAYEQKEFEESEEWLFLGKDFVLNDPQLEAEFLHQLGKLYGLQKNYEEAYEYLDKAKKLDDFNGNVVKTRALFLVEEGKSEQAISEVELALKQAPTNPFFLDALGLVYLKSGEFEKAKKKFENALVYDPNDPEIIEHLGDAHIQLGEKEKALENWNKAFELGRSTDVLKRKIADQTYYAE